MSQQFYLMRTIQSQNRSLISLNLIKTDILNSFLKFYAMGSAISRRSIRHSSCESRDPCGAKNVYYNIFRKICLKYMFCTMFNVSVKNTHIAFLYNIFALNTLI